jgi:hypothetical protein
MVEAPALQLTPDAMAQQILRTSEQVRAGDARLLGLAQQAMTGAAHRMEAVVEKAETAQEQGRARVLAAAIGMAAGILGSTIVFSIVTSA